MIWKQRKYKDYEIHPDEIFLDSHNLPDFNQHQFEGRLERPISKKTLFALGTFFFLVLCVFLGRVAFLEIGRGEHYAGVAENNHLRHRPLFAERGVIFDRNGVELVWNEPFEDASSVFARRKYIEKNGFAHILGFVRYPLKDKAGYYYSEAIEGKDGVERSYDESLRGENGLVIVEVNAEGERSSESTARAPRDGENITLSIDSRVQEKLHEEIALRSNESGFTGGAGIIMDIESGELLALTSFPEYDSEALSLGGHNREIERFINDPRKPFLNRAVSGLYTPGSIVKPFIALAALVEDIIDPKKEILSTGSIAIPNPYSPQVKSVFTDWKAHGWVSMPDAIAVSSNVYFYTIAGGFEDQGGLGIERLAGYMEIFGFGTKTGFPLLGEESGIVPTPAWKEKTFNDSWRIGDTYNTAIGQYGFQITPLQAVRATAALASDGILLKPSLLKGGGENGAQGEKDHEERILGFSPEYFRVVKEGMKQAVDEGTGSGLHLPQISVAAKTGTAEVGVNKHFVNSWVIGFFPYEKPRFAFAVVMEHGKRENTIGALYVMRQTLLWIAANTPEYLTSTSLTPAKHSD
ncbi:MAG: hypothetical protein HY457_00315 [Parcubacteria group bacterium]|nr:hypothetical protein [Parcubacteria group bacterium]